MEDHLHDRAVGLEHGQACPPELASVLQALVVERRRSLGLEAGPPAPAVHDLRLHREGLPDWWDAGGNLLLLGKGAQPPDLKGNPFIQGARRAVVAVGRGARFAQINLAGEGALVVIGDGVVAMAGALSCLGRSTVLIGEGTTCTNWAMLDCRNGGMILTGADGMWAHGVSLMSDDTHAIRDAETGRRLNAFGGRIVVDRHVWLCELARVLDGARIGADAVIGAGALVKRATIPANTVAVGAPARVVRQGVTWSREDVP